MSLSRQLNLTDIEQELFCKLLADETLRTSDNMLEIEHQALLARLIERYDHGDVNTLQDPLKAMDYKAQAGISEPTQNAALFETRSKFLTAHRFFTWLRVLIARLNRFLAEIHEGFLPRIFSVLGLSYGVSLVLELLVIVYDVFQPTLSTYEVDLSTSERIFHRLKLAFSNRDRLSRMTNDALWFSINLTTLILLGPVALIVNPIINMSGLGFDVLHDGFFAWLNAADILSMSDKIHDQIDTNQRKIDALSVTLDDEIKKQYPATKGLFKQQHSDELCVKERAAQTINVARTTIPAKDNRLITDTRQQLSVLHTANNALKKMVDPVDNMLDLGEQTGIRLVSGAILVLIGSIFLLFPPIGSIIGASLGILGGCVMCGAGPWVYDKACSVYNSVADFFNPPSIVNPELTTTTMPTLNQSYIAIKQELKDTAAAAYESPRERVRNEEALDALFADQEKNTIPEAVPNNIITQSPSQRVKMKG